MVGGAMACGRMAKLVEATEYMSHAPTKAINYAYYRDVEATGFWFQFTPGVNAGIIRPTKTGAVCLWLEQANEGRLQWRPRGEFNRLLRQAELTCWTWWRQARESANSGAPVCPVPAQPWGPEGSGRGCRVHERSHSAHGISDGLRDAELCARAVDRALSYPGECPRR